MYLSTKTCILDDYDDTHQMAQRSVLQTEHMANFISEQRSQCRKITTAEMPLKEQATIDIALFCELQTERSSIWRQTISCAKNDLFFDAPQ